MLSDSNDLSFHPELPDANSVFCPNDFLEELNKQAITEDLVVKTLRSQEMPETIFWLLRTYLESHNSPTIRTDRGKTIYIDYDRLEETISIYIGDTTTVNLLGQTENSKIYIMDVIERYDFIWYANLKKALKRHLPASAILYFQARNHCSHSRIPQTPTLFFTTGAESVCIMRTNWSESSDMSHSISQPRLIDDFDAKVNSVVDLLNGNNGPKIPRSN